MSPPVLTSDEAIALAAELSIAFGRGAAERDARRILPVAELDRLSESGLLAITVPARYGGADVPVATPTPQPTTAMPTPRPFSTVITSSPQPTSK